MNDPTLLLNANHIPISILPLSTMSWQDAMRRLWTDEVEALHNYDDWVIHSPSISVPVPAVCVLRQQVKVKRQKLKSGGPQADLVFLRDGYQCQYCEKVFPRRKLTLDHVVPRKHGGKTAWENLSSACEPCNGARGHDVGVRPINVPFRPSHDHLIKMMRRFPIYIPHPAWNDYLGWSPDMVKVCSPRKNLTEFMQHENFDTLVGP